MQFSVPGYFKVDLETIKKLIEDTEVVQPNAKFIEIPFSSIVGTPLQSQPSANAGTTGSTRFSHKRKRTDNEEKSEEKTAGEKPLEDGVEQLKPSSPRISKIFDILNPPADKQNPIERLPLPWDLPPSMDKKATSEPASDKRELPKPPIDIEGLPGRLPYDWEEVGSPDLTVSDMETFEQKEMSIEEKEKVVRDEKEDLLEETSEKEPEQPTVNSKLPFKKRLKGSTSEKSEQKVIEIYLDDEEEEEELVPSQTEKKILSGRSTKGELQPASEKGSVPTKMSADEYLNKIEEQLKNKDNKNLKETHIYNNILKKNLTAVQWKRVCELIANYSKLKNAKKYHSKCTKKYYELTQQEEWSVELRREYKKFVKYCRFETKDLELARMFYVSLKANYNDHPKYFKFTFELAKVSEQLDDFDAAFKLYKELIKVENPYQGEALNEIGFYWEHKKSRYCNKEDISEIDRQETSFKFYKKATEVKHPSASAFYNLGRCYENTGKTKEALRTYRAGGEKNDGPCLLNFGILLQKQVDKSKSKTSEDKDRYLAMAKKAFEKASNIPKEVFEHAPYAALQLGKIYFREKNAELAKQYLEKAAVNGNEKVSKKANIYIEKLPSLKKKRLTKRV